MINNNRSSIIGCAARSDPQRCHHDGHHYWYEDHQRIPDSQRGGNDQDDNARKHHRDEGHRDNQEGAGDQPLNRVRLHGGH